MIDKGAINVKHLLCKCIYTKIAADLEKENSLISRGGKKAFYWVMCGVNSLTVEVC